MNKKLCVWGAAMAVSMPLAVAAQAANTEALKAVPQLTYASAFADYKPYKDAPLANWRELNVIVAGATGGASGHAAHMMGGTKGNEMPASPAPSARPEVPMRPATSLPPHGAQP